MGTQQGSDAGTFHPWCREGHRLEKIEDDMRQANERIVVMEDRLQRMHDDFRTLTQALNENTAEITKLTQWTLKRGSFVAGVIFVLGMIGTSAVALLGYARDWFQT